MALYGWVGDTLWVSDASTRRTTLISPGRTLVRTFRWPIAVHSTNEKDAEAVRLMTVIPRGMLVDGSLLVLSYLSSRERMPAWAKRAGDEMSWAVRTSPDGDFKNVVVGLPTVESCNVTGSLENGGQWGLPVPFCARPHWSIASDGTRIVLSAQPAGTTRNSATYSVTSVSSTGDTVFSRQFTYTPTAIAQRVADSTRAAFRANVARQFPPAAVRAVEEMRLPSLYPAIKSVVAGRDATTWLERWTPPGDHLWHVLDASGNLVGALTLPVNVTLHTASRDGIWAVEKDDDGLESVVRYRITRPR